MDSGLLLGLQKVVFVLRIFSRLFFESQTAARAKRCAAEIALRIKIVKVRQRQDSNLRGQGPIDFESIVLTTPPRCLALLRHNNLFFTMPNLEGLVVVIHPAFPSSSSRKMEPVLAPRSVFIDTGSLQ
jgi:hypothetical protein